MKPVKSDIQGALQLRNKELWVLGKNHKSSVESQYRSIFFASTPLSLCHSVVIDLAAWNFQWQKIQHSPDRSGHFWICYSEVFMSNLESDSVISPSLPSGMVHPKAHLISFPSDTVPKHMRTILFFPKFSSPTPTLSKSPLSVLMAFRGPQGFLIPRAWQMTSICPVQILGKGLGHTRNLANVAPWSKSTCSNPSLSSVPILYPRFSTAHCWYFGQIILFGGAGGGAGGCPVHCAIFSNILVSTTKKPVAHPQMWANKDVSSHCQVSSRKGGGKVTHSKSHHSIQ